MSKNYKKDQMTLYANLPTFLCKKKRMPVYITYNQEVNHCLGKAKTNSIKNNFPFEKSTHEIKIQGFR